MTRIDFYVVSEAGEEARLTVAARLVDKALGRGHRIFINTQNEQQALQLDKLLWTFRPESFIPHALACDDMSASVVLGWGQEPVNHDDVLINLEYTAPVFFSRFLRVAEVVTQDGESLDALRTAWRFYRDRGYPLHKHDL